MVNAARGAAATSPQPLRIETGPQDAGERPAAPAGPAPDPATAPPAPGLPRRRSVLVVDDDRSARTALAAILRMQSYEVTEAGSVAEAVGRLHECPDWILLDLMLSDGSGCGVLRALAAEGIPSRVCVITGAAPALIDTARALGPEHVLRKPLDVTRLLSIVAT